MNNKMKTFFGIGFLSILSLSMLIACTKPAEGRSESSEPIPSSISSEETYNIVRPEFDGDYTTFEASANPTGFNISYYKDIYSRGFAWITDENTEGTDLYLVQSDKGDKADFSSAEHIEGTSLKLTYDTSGNVTGDGIEKAKGSGNTKETKIVSHKVHVENLEKGKAYSYKVGSEAGWVYGAFVVEKDQPETITAINMSDAQTKDLSKLNVWRNTFVKAVETAGSDLDFAIHNGDQFDQNNSTGNDKEPFRLFRYAKSVDVIRDYKFDIPYMISSGNHEPSTPYCQYFMNDVDYAGYDYKGAYYSYDYNFAHFVVLNTNTVNDAQLNWLKSDLASASNAKWIIVAMHISPYSSGDHSNKSENQSIVEKFTPIFSEYHVDLVFQAHDHTYNKTLPYRWDAAGYTTTDHDDSVVNYDVVKETINNVEYDSNPDGTYYVTTGAAGHRVGAAESDGIWAEVVVNGETVTGLNPSKTFLTNKYKNAFGTLTKSNSYEPCTWGSYSSSQEYLAGNPATGNVNAQMFGVLNLTDSTMSYHIYTVNDNTVKLFDTLDVIKD